MRRTPKVSGVEDAIAPAPHALAQDLLFLAHGSYASHRPAIDRADTCRLPNTRRIGSGDGRPYRANSSTGNSAGADMFPKRYFVRIVLTIRQVRFVLLPVPSLEIHNRTTGIRKSGATDKKKGACNAR